MGVEWGDFPSLHVSKFSSILSDPFVLRGFGDGFDSLLIFYCRSVCRVVVVNLSYKFDLETKEICFCEQKNAWSHPELFRIIPSN